LTCLTRRRCRTALFSLKSDRHLGPLVLLCCCSAERSQPAAHRAQLYHQLRSGKRGGRRTCLQRQAASFCCALCSLFCGAQGKLRCSARLRAVCLLLLHSALDVVARRAALKYAAAAAGGGPRCRLCGRGQGAMAARLWWAGVVPPGSCAGRAPLAADDLMSGESAGPCGVLAPSLT